MERNKLLASTATLTTVVTNEELRNWRFLRDVRNYAASLRWEAGAALDNLFTEVALQIDKCTDSNGIVQELDLTALEAEVYDEYNDKLAEELEAAFAERFRLWWRDTFSEPCLPTLRPYVRLQARERWRVVATILRAMAGDAAAKWGKPTLDEMHADETQRQLAARDRIPLADRDKKRRSGRL